MLISQEQVSKEVLRLHITIEAEESQQILDDAFASFNEMIEPKEGFSIKDTIREAVGSEEAFVEFCNKIAMNSVGPHIISDMGLDTILNPLYSCEGSIEAGKEFPYTMEIYLRPKMTLRSYEPLIVNVYDDVPEEYLEDAAAEECSRAVADRIVESVPIPLLEACKRSLYEEFDGFLAQRCGGISRDEYFAQMGMSAKDFDKQMNSQARENLRQDLALDAVFEHLGGELSEEDINFVLHKMGPGHEQEMYDSFAKAGQLYTLYESARRMKASHWLAHEASIYRVPRPRAQEGGCGCGGGCGDGCCSGESNGCGCGGCC